MSEYLESDLEIRRAFSHVIEDFVARGGHREVIEPLMSVRPSFLDAALDAMHDEYGSIEAYFRRGLRISTSRRWTRFAVGSSNTPATNSDWHTG